MKILQRDQLELAENQEANSTNIAIVKMGVSTCLSWKTCLGFKSIEVLLWITSFSSNQLLQLIMPKHFSEKDLQPPLDGSHLFICFVVQKGISICLFEFLFFHKMILHLLCWFKNQKVYTTQKLFLYVRKINLEFVQYSKLSSSSSSSFIFIFIFILFIYLFIYLILYKDKNFKNFILVLFLNLLRLCLVHVFKNYFLFLKTKKKKTLFREGVCFCFLCSQKQLFFITIKRCFHCFFTV